MEQAPPKAPPTLLTLPLEIRVLIYQYALPTTITADCCEQASSTSNPTRRLPSNPWYPSPELPTFTYPSPHLPLRLLCHQANSEILTHVPLPPLTIRTCDFLCLRRALSIVSSQPLCPPNQVVARPHHAISGPRLSLKHVSTILVTSERISMSSSRDPQPGESCSKVWAKLNRQARVATLAKSYEGELRRHWREVSLPEWRWGMTLKEELEARRRGEGPLLVELEMSFSVERMLRGGLVVGDAGCATNSVRTRGPLGLF